MKILIRSAISSRTTLVGPETCAGDHSTPWPEGFTSFLESIGEPCESVELRQEDAKTFWIPHGNHGSAVKWTIDSPLQGSWRVSAYHSNVIANIKETSNLHPPRADGIITSGQFFKNPLAINTADCLAVAVTLEQAEGIIMASCFHAGWRGYTSGIQQNALSSLLAASSENKVAKLIAEKLWITIGPAIAGTSYPCGEDVLLALEHHHNRFLKTSPGWTQAHEVAFQSAVGLAKFSTEGKIYPDLQALICLELHSYGVPLKQVNVVREDTRKSSWWPSHRRSVAEGENGAKRFVTHLCPPTCRQL